MVGPAHRDEVSLPGLNKSTKILCSKATSHLDRGIIG
jgi:hypothetical protein